MNGGCRTRKLAARIAKWLTGTLGGWLVPKVQAGVAGRGGPLAVAYHEQADTLSVAATRDFLARAFGADR